MNSTSNTDVIGFSNGILFTDTDLSPKTLAEFQADAAFLFEHARDMLTTG